MITLTIPNDDHIALRAFGKALEEMSLAHGAEPRKTVGELTYKLNIDSTEVTAALERLNAATGELMQAAQRMMGELRCAGDELQGKRKEPEVDTTAQQLESLAVPGATHIITEQKLVGDPVPVGDGNFSQGYIATVEEIADPTDSTGIPWDERIHSASKALNADGTWRLRRKPKDMDEAEWVDMVDTIKLELIHRAPPMTPSGEELCIDEGCDHHGTPHICVTPEPPVTPQAYLSEDVTIAGLKPTETEEPVLEYRKSDQYAPENYVYMYRAADNIYALAKSDGELAEFEADGYVRHSQEQYNVWEGPNEGDDYHTDADVVTEQTVAGIPPLPVPPPVALPGSTGATDLLPPPPAGTALTQPAWDFPRLMTFLTERHGKIDVATVNTLLAQDGLASLQELNAHPDKIGPFVARVKAHLGE